MSTHQLAFFGSGKLFSDAVLRQYKDEKRTVPTPAEEPRMAMLREWIDSLQENARHLDESSLEQSFNTRVLCGVLGYTLYPDKLTTAWPKPPSSVTRMPKKPDVVLGELQDATEIRAVLELKKPGVDLDAPQPREDHKSPVEQAFDYGEHILGVQWVLVSDMREIRLYSIESRTEFESFAFDTCCRPGQKERFRHLYALFSYENLIQGGRQSPVARIFDKSHERRLRIRDSFYDVYYRIRYDLHTAIATAALEDGLQITRSDALQATQRLLDRLLFLFYCEHHPQQLIPRDTVSRVVAAAASLPGPNTHKVYDALKALFREVDAGSTAASGLKLDGYNGELFKLHPVIDAVDLPDTLSQKAYGVSEEGLARHIRGVWGLHSFDFWTELNEHLLGHIFEESLSDLVELASSASVTLHDKLEERRRHGIYFTDQTLAEFLATSAIRSHVHENLPPLVEESADAYAERLEYLRGLSIVDFACGSGAFLVSSYNALLEAYLRTEERLLSIMSQGSTAQLDMLAIHAGQQRKALLRNSLHGIDLLPQAIEIAKLALWLRSARKGEKVEDLSANLVSGDSLDIPRALALLAKGPGAFDLVLGNPPWGGDIDRPVLASACHTLGLDPNTAWDSWELFLMLSIYALKDGGRLGLVLPDTLFSPEKTRTRRLLLEQTQLEKVYNLGPDWFGPRVRMSTIVVQARKGQALESSYLGLYLNGKLRREAQRGTVPLAQIDASLASPIPQSRSLASDSFDIEVFRQIEDDAVMDRMYSNSTDLAELCERGRGEEMAKSGLLWVCPGCMAASVPGAKTKGGHYRPKSCPACQLELTEDSVTLRYLVTDEPDAGRPFVGFMDGDDIGYRYRPVTPHRFMYLDEEYWTYKPDDLYSSPKIMIRQAGVGLWALIDLSGSRCPQSVYIYRLRQTYGDDGYDLRFILGCLLSRTMAYYVVKRFCEGDPAKAHVKVTHDRLAKLPIARVDFSDARSKSLHDSICNSVSLILEGQSGPKGVEDHKIERSLRELWGLDPGHGVRINEQLHLLPASRLLEEMFDGID